MIGVCGVMSYAASERRREPEIRVAPGELPFRIRRRVLDDELQLAALGDALGAVAALLTVVTVLAADGPARRA